MLRSCVLAAAIGVLLSSAAMAEDHVDREKLTQAIQNMFPGAPGSKVTIMGTAAASTPISDVVYFSLSGPDGRAVGWYIANCAKLVEGGWVCPVAPVGQGFIITP